MIKTSLSLALISIGLLLEGTEPKKEECNPCAKTMRASVRHTDANVGPVATSGTVNFNTACP